MYGEGVLGSPQHKYLYICNTSCFAVTETGDLVELNSAIHSLIGENNLLVNKISSG